eukprot:CAMPEP_0174725088 /NCGR_PEP_ID=MMETSP1094-20130205/44779_1 /TAXON_ID=156173 /ORGANISM="Chrysochromulina brevifilum, Strain UTEX LB 985" /LENGTH=70 /DNA_ID=CAMNT_0015926415 /DNA_START=211 /DNA_END=423 /DNA_ORIENTATION=+
MRIIQDVFPGAEVKATQVNKRPIRVKISTGDGVEIIDVDQKMLFAKRGWPAEGTIKKALQEYQENSITAV